MPLLTFVLLSTLPAPPARADVPTGVRAAPAAVTAVAAPAGTRTTDACLRSVPEPGTRTPVRICFTLFRPPGATRAHPVPAVLHGHPFGGSRATDAEEVAPLLRRGLAVLSFDQRGFGDSGGVAHFQTPAIEGRDVALLVRRLARTPWVLQDGPGDPRVGAMGASYGGGFQLMAALTLRRGGRPVLDAIAPQMTWFDLNHGFAPSGVVRSTWTAAVGAVALATQSLPRRFYDATALAIATGRWPDGSSLTGADLAGYFRPGSVPSLMRGGRRIDVPTLLGQGLNDTLLPLDEALSTWRRALTPQARRDSILVGYLGGHLTPGVALEKSMPRSDPCTRRVGSSSFPGLSVAFLDEQLNGADRGLRGYGRIHLATSPTRCTSLTTRATRTTRAYRAGARTTTVDGVTELRPLVRGPATVAGTPYLTGRLTTTGRDARTFLGLAVGPTAREAELVDHQVLPLVQGRPVTDVRRRVPLTSVTVRVPRGQRLWLVSSAVSDHFITLGPAPTASVRIDDTVVHLPVTRR